MPTGPFQVFCDELDALIDKWRSKPEDDQLTSAEVVGALEFQKQKIMLEAIEIWREDEA